MKKSNEKERGEKIIGIDVSKQTLDVVLLNSQEKILLQKQWKNTLNGILKIIKLAEKNDCFVVMEATGVYHLNLANHLHAAKRDVSVVNPLVIKRYAEMRMLRAKTDKLDAKIIACYGLNQKLQRYVPPSENQDKIKIISHFIDNLKKLINQNKNQIEALKHHTCPYIEIIDIYKKKNMELEEEVKVYTKKLNKLISDTYPEESKKVLKIKGVGLVLCSIIFGYYRNFEHFENAKQVVAYAGLNPSPYQSGTSVKKKARISKRGDTRIRNVLYCCSLSAKRYNPDCKALYERLISKGKSKKEARIAVAAKLLRQCFAVVKYKREYKSFYYLEQQENYSKKMEKMKNVA